MKKSLFLLPLLAISLAACGGGGGGSSKLIATYDFTGLQGKGSAITDPQTSLGSLGTVITWTSATKIFDGNGTGGGKPNTAGFLKFGTGDTSGILTFTVSENVSRIVLNCHSFYKISDAFPTNTNNYAVSVNESTPTVVAYNATGDGEDVTIDLAAATNEITIKSCDNLGGVGRILLYSLSLYS